MGRAVRDDIPHIPYISYIAANGGLYRTQEHVALKIRAARSSEVSTERETMEHITRKSDDVDAGPGSQHVLTIIDSFEHDGEQGKHVCLVLKAMGPVVSEYRWLFPQKRIPIPIVKSITRQLLEALVFLHDRCGVIHTGVFLPIPLAISACLRFQTVAILTRTMQPSYRRTSSWGLRE